MEEKKITVTIKDKDGKVLLEYSEPVEISRGAMENITWIKKGVWTIKELLNINISQELDRAREEGARDVFAKDEWFTMEELAYLGEVMHLDYSLAVTFGQREKSDIGGGLLRKLDKLNKKK